MSTPPYWPFRCRACKRFVSKPRVRYTTEQIVATTGNCKRCGPDIPLMPTDWEDWFGDDDPPFPGEAVDP